MLNLLVIMLMVLLSFAIEEMWVRMMSPRKYRYFVAPGVIIHELSHVLGCLMTGAKISSVKLFEPTGGSVTHSPPRLPIVGNVVISCAPVFGTVACLWLLTLVMGNPFSIGEYPVGLLSSPKALIVHVIDVSQNIMSVDFRSWVPWLYLYLFFSITACLAPSRQDFKNCWKGLFLIVVLVIGWNMLIHYWPQVPSLGFLSDALRLPLSISLAIVMFSFLFSLLFFSGFHAIKALRKGAG